MPERFIVPSLNDVAKTVNKSIEETKQWTISSKTAPQTKKTTKRIAA